MSKQCAVKNKRYAIKIQKVYRKYKLRHNVNISKMLPLEIRQKIRYHIVENELIEKYHHAIIRKIINNKIDNYHKMKNLLLYNKSSNYFNNITTEVVKYITIFSKYYETMDYLLHYKVNKFINKILFVLSLDYNNDASSYNILKNIQLYNIEIYLNLISNRKTYKKLYVESDDNYKLLCWH